MKRVDINKFKPLVDTDDPIAKKVGWDKTQSDISFFNTQGIYVSQEKIMITRSRRMTLWYTVVLGGVIWCIWSFLYNIFLGHYDRLFYVGIFFAFAITFFLPIAKYIPFTIDFISGGFYFGNSKNASVLGAIGDIHAIQLLQAKTTSDGRAYTNYELNLVLKDANRINIMVDPKLEPIMRVAKEISRVLKVPIWQAEYG